MGETATNSLASKFPKLLSQFKSEVVSEENLRDLAVVVKPGKIREIIHFLKTDPDHQFVMMLDLFAMDYLKFEPETPERYAVVYILYSFKLNDRIRLKVFLPEANPQIDSIYDLYKAANWFEREAWDLFGVTFKGHPNLIRILCHNEFVGHPLRKDYPADQYQRLKNAAPSTGF